MRVFVENYCKSIKVEVDNLGSIGSWYIVDRDYSMNTIDSEWYFKCKRYPDGLIKSLKYLFCARGDQ